MKILVVEDEPTLNKIIAKRLKIEAYSVDCAFNGKEALEYLDAAEYDLLIVDIMMPEMDGLTLVKKVRSQGSQVPVLFLTALDSTQDKVTGLDCGGDDYLVKPFEFDELLARIRSLLRRSNSQQTARTQLSLADLTLDTRTHQVTPERPGDHLDSQGIFRAGLSPAEPGDRPFPGTDLGTCLGFFL